MVGFFLLSLLPRFRGWGAGFSPAAGSPSQRGVCPGLLTLTHRQYLSISSDAAAGSFRV